MLVDWAPELWKVGCSIVSVDDFWTDPWQAREKMTLADQPITAAHTAKVANQRLGYTPPRSISIGNPMAPFVLQGSAAKLETRLTDGVRDGPS